MSAMVMSFGVCRYFEVRLERLAALMSRSRSRVIWTDED
jgi:hypothetical protein